MLSPFIDGELDPGERVTVERHLSACKDCTMRSADLRAEAGLMRVGMEMLTDEVDFKDFSLKVMARLTPAKPPLLERLKISLSEMFTYQRRLMVTSMATAAVVMLVVLPLILRNGRPPGYASQRLEVQTVSIDETAHVAPVVMETESGDTLIWTVDHHPHDTKAGAEKDDEARHDELELDPDAEKTKLKQDGPKGGEL